MTDDEVLVRFGSRLKTLRERRGLSAEAVASLMHLTPDAVRKYERGDREVGILRILQAKSVLGCGWMTLVGDLTSDDTSIPEYNVLSDTAHGILKHLATEWDGDVEALIIMMGLIASFPEQYRREIYMDAELMKDRLLQNGIITQDTLPPDIDYMESQLGKLYSKEES